MDNDFLRRFSALIDAGISPRDVILELQPNAHVPEEATDLQLWRMILAIMEPPRRKKLTCYNTIDDAIKLIKQSKNIIVLSGAGISTSAGLPDFRSRNGIYVQIHEEYPDLDDPKSMFDIDYFRRNPLPFYRFAKALYPGQFKPTVGHQFIKSIEDHNQLLRNYSQNIDTLENQAGIKRLVECHGSFAKASCTSCKYEVSGDDIKEDILRQKVPYCPRCKELPDGPNDGLGVMKPNIVFFGEQLGPHFHSSLDEDKDKVDLLIVIGSSLKVKPVALIPRSIPPSVPQILINKEPLEHMDFDIELLGDCDVIIQELCLRLQDDWNNICEPNVKPLTLLTGPSHIKTATAVATTTKANDNDASQNRIICGSTEGSSVSGEASQNQPATQEDSDDDWVDIESSSSDSDDGSEKVDAKVPEASFVHITPNKYLFPGVELTRHELRGYTREYSS